jgi:hypothetical protein
MGHAYRIQSRNLWVGIYNGNPITQGSDGGYVGIREKFGNRYLFTEFDFETGAPFGTATPYEDMGPCPITDLAEGHAAGSVYVTNQPLFEWLQSVEKSLEIICSECGKPFIPDIFTDDGQCWWCVDATDYRETHPPEKSGGDKCQSH